MADFSAWVERNKGLWTRVYDEVIQPDLEKEWKKRMYNQLTRRRSLTTYQGKRSIIRS
jgi:hypothetical protein